jgi:Transcriptional regulators
VPCILNIIILSYAITKVYNILVNDYYWSVKQMTKPRKATVHDIAAEVGTSSASVSRVLSNSGYPVSPELRDKIMETAKKLNYVPNIVGRMLKKSMSYDIGLVIPSITNPFYAQVALGAETVARKNGYNIFISNTMRDASIEKQCLDSLFQKQVAGIIISSIAGNSDVLKNMKENGVSLVSIDNTLENTKCNVLLFDYKKGAVSAMDYLVEMGHKRIAFISSPLTRKSRREVFEGYKAGLVKNGLKFDESLVFVSESEKEASQGIYEYNNGALLTEKLLESGGKPTAIFSVNDMTAFGVIKQLRESGLNVPDDIAVTGFDNIEFSSIISPSLTTVEQPSFETGEIACRLLLDEIENETGPVSMSLEPKLIIRNSVKKI